MSREIALFKRRLTNLSSANPLLWISRLRSEIHLDLFDWESQGQAAWELVAGVLTYQNSIKIGQRVDARDESRAQLSFKLQKLARQQKLGIEERGVDELYLAYPFVCGYWPDGQPLRTPLLYFPIRLKAGPADWSLSTYANEGFVNPAFLLAYAHHFQSPLAEALYDKDLPIDEPDGVAFLTQLYHLLKEQNLGIHFNQDLFAQRISPFKAMSKQDAFENLKAGQLKLFPHAVLGLFPQSNSLLIPDFNFLEEQRVSLEELFTPRPIPVSGAPVRHHLMPLPVDGSQESCISQIKEGKNLVVQGPPGSGKSQLISNLVADAMGSGKTVLVVCQKRVALEVVQQRLGKTDLGKSVCLWADPKKDRLSLYEKLAQLIENLEETEKKYLQLETVVLERHHNLLNRQIAEVSQKLDRWKNALIQLEPAGKTILDLYQMAENLDAKLPEEPFTAFHWDDWQHFSNWYRKFGPEFHRSLGADSPFKHRKNWSQNLEEMPGIWNSLFLKAKELNVSLSKSCKKEDNTILSLRHFHDQKDWIEAYDFARWSEKIKLEKWLSSFPEEFLAEAGWRELKRKIARLQRAEAELKNWPEGLIIPVDLLPRSIHLLQTKIWIFNLKPIFWLSSQLFQEWSFIRNLTDRLKQADAPEVLQFLLHAEEWRQAIQAFFPADQNVLTYGYYQELSQCRNDWAKLLEEGDEARKNLLEFRSRFSGKWAGISDAIEQEQEIKKLSLACCNIIQQWNAGFLSDETGLFFESLQSPESCLEKYQHLKQSIALTDGQLLQISGHWKEMMRLVLDSGLMENETEEQLKALQQNWIWAWIKKLESAEPSLAEAGNHSWEVDLNLLRNAVRENQTIGLKILQQALNEKQCKNLEYNRLGNRTTYRELLHQVRKKRNRPSLRKLWSEHSAEITRLVPAWLCTPESVSSTWPMASLFDLVIFDEASQCFAERGLPAAYRGRQLVIVGDDKQLPPNTLFSTRWDNDGDEDDNAFTAQDSFLNLARQFLPQIMLRGHYRSHFPELIAFSNRAFYQGKLEFLPHATALRPRPSALEWTFANGIWENQQNLQEAQAIAAALPGFLERHPDETLGIIAFSARQQSCIENEIARSAAAGRFELPDWLFVKNIENVQGDERDHIWFSVAYGKNPQDKMSAQYGLLGQEGGENRLNVAITRARKAVRVFASMLPDELALSEQAGAGPRLLKEYLKFVYQAHMEKLSVDPVIDAGIELAPEKEPGKAPTLIFHDRKALPHLVSCLDYFVYKFYSAQEKGYTTHYVYSKPLA